MHTSMWAYGYCSSYVYKHTLSPDAQRPPSRCLPTAEPGTRCLISVKVMTRGDETPRTHQGSAPHLSRDGCAEPLRLERLSKPEAFSLRGGLGPSRTACLEGGIGSKIRDRENYANVFSVRENQSLYTRYLSRERHGHTPHSRFSASSYLPVDMSRLLMSLRTVPPVLKVSSKGTKKC